MATQPFILEKLRFEIAPAGADGLVCTPLVAATTNERLMAWRPGAILKPAQAGDVPSMVMFFRALDRPKPMIYQFNIPANLLGLVRLGRVWHKGRLIGRSVVDKRDFDVNFDIDGWQFTSAKKVWDAQEKHLPDPEKYLLGFARDQSSVLDWT